MIDYNILLWLMLIGIIILVAIVLYRFESLKKWAMQSKYYISTDNKRRIIRFIELGIRRFKKVR